MKGNIITEKKERISKFNTTLNWKAYDKRRTKTAM
jgi:hypothetical protein